MQAYVNRPAYNQQQDRRAMKDIMVDLLMSLQIAATFNDRITEKTILRRTEASQVTALTREVLEVTNRIPKPHYAIKKEQHIHFLQDTKQHENHYQRKHASNERSDKARTYQNKQWNSSQPPANARAKQRTYEPKHTMTDNSSIVNRTHVHIVKRTRVHIVKQMHVLHTNKRQERIRTNDATTRKINAKTQLHVAKQT